MKYELFFSYFFVRSLIGTAKSYKYSYYESRISGYLHYAYVLISNIW